MFHFLPVAIRYDGSAPTEGHGYQVHVGPMYSDARGSVKINRRIRGSTRRCASTTCPPSRTAASGWSRSGWPAPSSPSPPSSRSTPASCRPGPAVETDQEILDWVARDAETALHPSCTARMGVDEVSVLDPQSMRVHGVDGLRVVDASSMPYVTNGNIYAPIMMLAEKAADLILGNTPLAPSTAPFYRYRDNSPLYPDSPRHVGGQHMSTHAAAADGRCRPRRRRPVEDLRQRRREDHRDPGRRPLAQGPAGQDRLRDGGEGRLVRGHAGRGVRGDGPVRVGQVHPDPAAHPAHRADRGPGRDERRGHHRGQRRPAARAAPPPRGHGVPALRAAAAPQGDRQRGLRAGGARRGQGAAAAPGPRRWSTWSG